jgi:hypothetical protein
MKPYVRKSIYLFMNLKLNFAATENGFLIKLLTELKIIEVQRVYI